MKNPQFRYYTRLNGHNEFEEFYLSLPKSDRRKLLSTIKTVEDQGIQIASKLQITKKLEDNLYELRSKMNNNIQRAIYFHVVDNNYVITHGFTKKTQKTPRSEINHAKSIRTEFESRDD
ncbi:type II toxin-antitoxin system RelE/ParE family toxin [Companilactobacillus hulinensis]|uniref:type II toxin-antitoxin system RelE/ParE family toxin n=1 Tax=Companilactobacillus hulinensis TaxID=2486007 RepID=UPI000F7A1157|nr:type II toxin-antitoxin system RelE/ParE family toxin [Companilactobacillus hulinensis]